MSMQHDKGAMQQRGFTLLEMLVVLALVGMLAAAARPLLELSAQRSREHELRQGLRTLRTALDAYKRASDQGSVLRAPDESGYPPNLDVLVTGVQDARDPTGRRIYFLRRLPRDPFAPPEVTAAESWGLRSHESPPDDPRPGKDVFDVHSRSERMALDGSQLKDW